MVSAVSLASSHKTVMYGLKMKDVKLRVYAHLESKNNACGADKAGEKALDAKQVCIVPSPYQTLQLPSARRSVSLRLRSCASPALSPPALRGQRAAAPGQNGGQAPLGAKPGAGTRFSAQQLSDRGRAGRSSRCLLAGAAGGASPAMQHRGAAASAHRSPGPNPRGRVDRGKAARSCPQGAAAIPQGCPVTWPAGDQGPRPEEQLPRRSGTEPARLAG